jgi:hypothetical protein
LSEKANQANNQNGWTTLADVSQMSTPRLAFLTAIMFSMAPFGVAQSTPLSVCQALNSDGDHREVVVRGKVLGGIHGLFIGEGENDDPCPGWPQRFFTLPSKIGLEFVSSHGVQLTEEQRRLNLDLLTRLHKFRVQGELRHYPITVGGVLVRKFWPLLFRRTDGNYRSFGWGPDEEYPVILVIKSIRYESNRI